MTTWPVLARCRPGCIETSQQDVLCTEGADAAFAGHALDGTFDVAICSAPRGLQILTMEKRCELQSYERFPNMGGPPSHPF